jgi:hypothetical protein
MHHTKFVVFMAVSVVLVAAVYSSSVSDVFAAKCSWILPIAICTVNTDQTRGPDQRAYLCIKNEKWHCDSTAPGKLPPELNDALDAAIQEESQNTTKVPETGLNDGSLLKGEGDNQTTSKKICLPGDIKCLLGLPPTSEAPETATSESEESNDTAGSNDNSELSEDFGDLEFGDNSTKPELQ